MSEQRRFLLIGVTEDQVRSREPEVRRHVQQTFAHNRRILDQIATQELAGVDLQLPPDSRHMDESKPTLRNPDSDEPSI